MAKQTSTALAALTFTLAPAAREIQLAPAGPAFRSADGSGRPGDVPAWRIDADIAERVIARCAARANRCVIDYEHQTLLAEKNGQPAPAAGWFGALEWRDGQGLFAVDVEWTERAAAMIAAGEYRYLSPVFDYDRRTGEVLTVRMAALTNDPGIDGMAAVALSAALAAHDFQPEEDRMNETLKKLLAAIGLPADAPEADALAAVGALKEKAGKADDAQTQLAALKAQAPDPARYAPVEAMQALQGEVAALKAARLEREVTETVEAALAAGKLTAPQKAWAEALGKSDLAALKAYVTTAPAITALTGMQTDGKPPAGAGGGGAATDAEVAVMKALGLTAEEFSKGKE
ncbi:MAG: phage protease [Rhodocyclaceae bacterium]|nr:phage protease [Rhodocyclaceae bacterium]